MRVILTHHIPKLGEVGDVREVAPGYGRNYLVPQGLAILATEGALKQIDDLKRTERRRQDRIRYDMERLAGRIRSLHLSFTAHVGETGRLYGSITASDIAAAIEAQLGEPVDRRKILLDESIRTLGDHEVPIHLMPGVDAQVKVEVVASEELVQDIGLMVAEEGQGDEVATLDLAMPPAVAEVDSRAGLDGQDVPDGGVGGADPDAAPAWPEAAETE